MADDPLLSCSWAVFEYKMNREEEKKDFQKYLAERQRLYEDWTGGPLSNTGLAPDIDRTRSVIRLDDDFETHAERKISGDFPMESLKQYLIKAIVQEEARSIESYKRRIAELNRTSSIARCNSNKSTFRNEIRNRPGETGTVRAEPEDFMTRDCRNDGMVHCIPIIFGMESFNATEIGDFKYRWNDVISKLRGYANIPMVMYNGNGIVMNKDEILRAIDTEITYPLYDEAIRRNKERRRHGY